MLVGVALVAFFAARWQQGATGPSEVQTETDTVAPGADVDTVVLYYVAEDGLTLVEHQQPLNLTAALDPGTRARIIAEQQLAEAPPPLASPFPPGTRVRALYLTPGGDAFVDLSADVSRGHPGGSLDELFTVYALVNAITTNVPEIRAVQILIGGREVDTLAGHVDLRHPLGRNLRWVARSDDAPTASTDDAAS